MDDGLLAFREKTRKHSILIYTPQHPVGYIYFGYWVHTIEYSYVVRYIPHVAHT